MNRLLFLAVLVPAMAWASGDWPEPRQNPQLTAVQPLPGKMSAAPELTTRFDLGRARPAITPVSLPQGGLAGLALVAGQLVCFNEQGHIQWTSHPPGLNFLALKTAGDLNGDGRAEVLLQAGRPADPYGAAVIIDLADGHVVWRYDVDPMSYSWQVYCGDYLPGRDNQELVVVMHGYPPDKENGYIALFEFPRGQLAPSQRWRYNFDQYTCFPTLLQSDLDGDGTREIVIETHSRMWFFDADSGAVRHFAQWDVSPANVRSYGLVEFVDLNDDGREDFLCIADFAQHHEVLLNRNGRMEKAWHYGWPESVTTGTIATTWPKPPYADLDGDGSLEIVVSMFNTEGCQEWLVRAYDALDGNLKFIFPGTIAVRCADVDGDGAAEILGHGSMDPTRKSLLDLRVLKVHNEQLNCVYKDAELRVLEDASGPVRVARGGDLFLLSLDERDNPALTPCTPPPPAPAPQFPEAPAILGNSAGVILAADLIGDGRNEILLYQDPHVRVLGWKDKELEVCAEYRSDSIPVIADFDKDGVQDLAISTVSSTAPPVVEIVTPSAANRGLWRSQLPAPGYTGLPAPRKAYLRSIRLTGKETPDLYAWFGTPLARSAGFDGRSGAVLWEKHESPVPERYWGPSVNYAAAADFNGQGGEDLVFTNPDYYCIADGPTGAPLLGPLHPPKIFNQPSQGLYTFPAILARSEARPLIALAGGHYFQAAMTIDAEPLWYVLPSPGESRCAAEGFLRLADGNWAMGFGRQNGAFACINVIDGSVRWEYPLQGSAADTVAGDVNGDGNMEFIVGTSHGDLVALRDDEGGRPHELWKKTLDAGITAVILADIDNDGATDIISATSDGWLNVLAAPPAS